MAAMAEVAERTLAGMGFELVDARASGGGRFLSIFIDRPGGITVDHCAEVSRQLARVFEVEGIDYDRMEVSSPGLDRPLRKAADWQRFAGSEIELTLRAPFQGRKHWRGQLQPREAGWRLVLPRDAGSTAESLDFELHEVRDARLVPQLDFKGRRSRPAAA